MPGRIHNLPFMLAGLVALVFAGLAPASQQVRPPAEVFLYEASADNGEIVIEWEVRPEHYLYRERFAFSTDTPGVTLGEPVYPDGEMHEDEFFGRQEIYRGEFTVRIPYEGDAGEVELDMRSQGCADIGLCYPPQNWPVTIALPAAAKAAADESARGNGGGGLRRWLGGRQSAASGQPDVLPPDQAFGWSASFTGANEITIHWDVKSGYYLYRDRFSVSVVDGPLELGAPRIPPGEPQVDEFFGETEVFFDDMTMTVPFSRASADAATVTLSLGFQGCAEIGLCYPPLEREVTLELAAATDTAGDNGAGFAAAGTGGGAAAGGGGGAPPVSEQDRLASLITGSSLWLVVATFFGLGLLLAFTPCVLPMVPILSGIIAGQGAGVTATKGFLLSVAYVLGMAVTYTAAGAIAAMAGAQVQAFFQQPWIIITFSALFIVLAMGMFGFFNLQLPAALQTRLAEVSSRQRAGTYAGTAVMGALSALIVSACVAPPLVASLAVIGQTGDVARGAMSLFAMSLGMGVPLLLVGASAGKFLPKAGPWMNAVKYAFGVMLLGVAVWMLERILPGAAALALWAGLAFIAAVFLGALDPLGDGAGPAKRLGKGLGVTSAAYGLILLVGAATGGNDPLQPLANFGLGGGGQQAQAQLDFRYVETVDELEAEIASASAAGRPVMLDFTADWCVSCKEMERYTFTAPEVHTALADAVLLKADVTANNRDDQALLRHFGIFGPPTIAFFDREGQERKGYRLVGFVAAEPFAEHARAALAP